MDYWGTIVVARADGLLVEQDGVAGFGFKHHWLRELGDGWQLLETEGVDGPPDLVGASAALVAATGEPVLGAYVSDGGCAATPGRVGPLTHLWPVGRSCGAYRHQPRTMAGPVGRGAGEVVAELVAWSAAAGLHADAAGLRGIIGRADAGSEADDLVFALVRALGLTRIGRTLPWSLPAYDWPFDGVMFGIGPAHQARISAAHRAAGVKAARQEEPWEAEAPALDAELWASLYRPGIDVAALARRAASVSAAYLAEPGESPGLDEDDLRMLAELEARLASGVIPESSEEYEARRQADARA